MAEQVQGQWHSEDPAVRRLEQQLEQAEQALDDQWRALTKEALAEKEKVTQAEQRIEELERLFAKARKSAHKTGTDERMEFFAVFQEADWREFKTILSREDSDEG